MHELSAHFIFADAAHRRVLVLPHADSWTLPSIEWTAPKNTDPFLNVFYFNRALEEQWGLQAVTLYGLQVFDDKTDEQLWVYAVENRGEMTCPRGAWLSPEDLAQRTPDRLCFHPLLETFFAETIDGDVPIEPWCMPGFFSAAEVWIKTQFTEPVRVEQYKQWYRGAIWRVEGPGQRHYFKACPQQLKHEVPVAQLFADSKPQWVPPIVATDDQRHWLLSADTGGRELVECADLDVWHEALRAYARLQIESIDLVDALDDQVPNWSLPVMAEAFADLLAQTDQLLQGYSPPFAIDELEALRERETQIRALCQQAIDCGVPHTLEHGDVHAGDNIHHTERGFVFYDWAEACITHPFIGFMCFLQTDDSFPDEPDIANRFQEVYLEMWTAYAPMNTLQQLMDLMPALRHLQQSFHYAQQIKYALKRIPVSARRPHSHAGWTIAQMQSWLPHFLRQLAMALNKLEPA